MDINSIIAAWSQYFLSLYNAGANVPLPPNMSDQTPAPAPPTAPEWVNGMSQPDSRGFVKLQAIEAERASDPRWANACTWYSIKSAIASFPLNDAQKLNIEANGVECAVLCNSALMGDHPFDNRALNQAFQALPPTHPGATYTRGPQFPDALAFPSGFVDKPDPTVADIPTFIATCNATGKYPVIDHTGVGAVA